MCVHVHVCYVGAHVPHSTCVEIRQYFAEISSLFFNAWVPKIGLRSLDLAASTFNYLVKPRFLLEKSDDYLIIYYL